MAMDEEQALPALIPVVSRPISLVPVGLKEAALDSPSFRATTVHFTEQVEAVEKWLDGFLKAIGKLSHETSFFESLVTSFLNSASPPTALSEAIIDHDYTLLAAQRYGDIAKDFWNTALGSLRKLESNMVDPVRALMQNEIRAFKDLRRQLEIAQRTFDNLQSRYSAQVKTKEQSALREDAFQLHEARKAYLKASMDFEVAAPQLRLALDKVLVKLFYDQAQTTWRNPGNAVSKWIGELDRVKGWSKEMEGNEKAFRREMINARKHIEENAEAAARPSRELDDYSLSTLPVSLTKGPASGLPSSKPKQSEKQGWLNLRTLTGKPTRTVWVRRWFYVKNGIFGCLVQGSKSGGVEESERIGVLLCGVRAAPQEERRFCFEVKTKDTSLVLQSDTQPELVEWMGTFDIAKQKALEDPESTDHFSSPVSQILDPAFAISPPSAPEFAASAADAGLHSTEEGHDRSVSLTLPETSSTLHRGSFDVTPGRRSATLDKEGEGSREQAARLMQKLDLSRKTQTGLSDKGGPTPGSGIASLISATHASMPIKPDMPTSAPAEPQGNLPVNKPSKIAFLARTLAPSSLAPSSLVNPPTATNLSATAVMVNGDRGIGVGLADRTGGMPSGIMANLWGSTNWGYINRFERGEVTSSAESSHQKPSLASSTPSSQVMSSPNANADHGKSQPTNGTENNFSADGKPRHRKTISLDGDRADLQRAAIVGGGKEFPNYYPVQLKHQEAQFRLLFPNVKKDEKLVLVFRATWNPTEHQEFPGRVYVTPRHIFFYSNHLGLVLVSGFGLDRISEITAAPGRDCDYLFVHLKGTNDKADFARLTVKTFLDPLKLLQRRLNFLVENFHDEEPLNLEAIMKMMIRFESEPEERSPSQDSMDDEFSSVENLMRQSSQKSSKDLRARVLVDQGLSGLGRAAERDTFRFKLPNKPVVYIPRGVTVATTERVFDISPKALFHVMFGDRSAVWQMLYLERRAQRIKQGPWIQEEKSHMRRAFEYNIETRGMFGQAVHAIVTDTQIIDVLNDHLCYVVTDRKTPWHLPYHDQYTLVSKIVITHETKSKCKLAIYTKVEWSMQPFLTYGMLERHALSDLKLDALDLVDVIAEQVRKLGAQSQTKRAIQIFGAVGQQTQATEFLDTDPSGARSLRRSMGRRTLTQLVFEALMALTSNLVASLLLSTVGLSKWGWRTFSTNRIILLILAGSVLTNLLYSSRETSGWWRERHAGQYMRRLGVGKDLVMSKAISLDDLEQVVAMPHPEWTDGVEGIIENAENAENACLQSFKRIGLAESSAFSFSSSSSFPLSPSEPAIQRLRRSRQHLGGYRHDLMVAMRVVNSVETELIRASWEEWIRLETDRCWHMGRVMPTTGAKTGAAGGGGGGVGGVGGGGENNAARNGGDVNMTEHFERYCSSCRAAEQAVLL